MNDNYNYAYLVAACLVIVYFILNELDALPTISSQNPLQHPKHLGPVFLPQNLSSIHSFNSNQPVTNTFDDQIDKSCLIFNALPKCGSRTLLTLAVMSDGYQRGSLSVDSNLTLLPKDVFYKQEFAKRFLSENLMYLSDPSFVYTHSRFVDVGDSFGKRSVRYLGIIREPLSRLVSTYYYRRNRDQTALTEKERKWRSGLANLSNESFDECVSRNRSECTGHFSGMSIIAHFCGADPKCSTNATWALARAKMNVVRHFEAVGIMEDYSSLVEVVECMFPSHFKGAVKNYRRLKTATMKTKGKVTPSRETEQVMTQKLQYDIKFYNFVYKRFYYLKRKHCSS